MKWIKDYFLRQERERIENYIEEERRILHDEYLRRADYLDNKYAAIQRQCEHIMKLQLDTLNLSPAKPKPSMHELMTTPMTNFNREG